MILIVAGSPTMRATNSAYAVKTIFICDCMIRVYKCCTIEEPDILYMGDMMSVGKHDLKARGSDHIP